MKEFKKYKIKSCLIKQNSEIVLEYYSNEKVANKLQKINSCTKSFAGTLVGICLDRGLIEDIDIPIKYYFPEIIGNDTDNRKQRITLRHLLSMSEGLDWPEFGEWNCFAPMAYSKDILNFVLSRPMVSEPGEKMNYNSGDSYIIGEIVAKVTGMKLVDFAEKELFMPLGIKDIQWLERDGHALCADGLRMKTSDMIKLGELYMNGGIFNSCRIVSEEWIQEALTPRYLTYEYIGSYCYHWWYTEFSLRIGKTPVSFALGYHGQFIVIISSLKIVAAITSEVNDSMMPIRVLEKYIDSII